MKRISKCERVRPAEKRYRLRFTPRHVPPTSFWLPKVHVGGSFTVVEVESKEELVRFRQGVRCKYGRKRCLTVGLALPGLAQVVKKAQRPLQGKLSKSQLPLALNFPAEFCLYTLRLTWVLFQYRILWSSVVVSLTTQMSVRIMLLCGQTSEVNISSHALLFLVLHFTHCACF